jgi:hypothetical protein
MYHGSCLSGYHLDYLLNYHCFRRKDTPDWVNDSNGEMLRIAKFSLKADKTLL